MQVKASTNLSNWRQHPHSQWAFQQVRQILPTADICSDNAQAPAVQTCTTPIDPTVVEFLGSSYTDSFLHYNEEQGLQTWCAQHCVLQNPHIVFSVTKSITAMLTGILVDEGLLDTITPVKAYLPGTIGTAYQDCTIQHLLDMTVALDFDENYLATEGQYVQYREATGWNPVDQTKQLNTVESFLYQLKKSSDEHGRCFNYRSPNTDLLGLILERVANESLASLLSSRIWRKLPTLYNAYITVDSAFLARAAGGLCVSAEDLLQFGIMILNQGTVNGVSIVPDHWIVDTLTQKNHTTWQQGDFVSLLPNGSYRNCWYHVGNASDDYCAIGIHGQWLYINPKSRSVIVKLSSQPEPLDETLDRRCLALFEELSN